jgi:hypothetical protein
MRRQSGVAGSILLIEASCHVWICCLEVVIHRQGFLDDLIHGNSPHPGDRLKVREQSLVEANHILLSVNHKQNYFSAMI